MNALGGGRAKPTPDGATASTASGRRPQKHGSASPSAPSASEGDSFAVPSRLLAVKSTSFLSPKHNAGLRGTSTPPRGAGPGRRAQGQRCRATGRACSACGGTEPAGAVLGVTVGSNGRVSTEGLGRKWSPGSPGPRVNGSVGLPGRSPSEHLCAGASPPPPRAPHGLK